MSVCYDLACLKCMESVPLFRRGHAWGPQAGDEHRFAFMARHEECLAAPDNFVLISENDDRPFTEFEP